MRTAELETETAALAVLEKCTAVQIFEPGFIEPVIERIEAEARSEAARLDISTDENRKAIASLAYKVARSKTFIDQQRLALVSDEKKRLKRIDQEGSRIWSRLEQLQAEVRKPLTDWEQAEKNRVASHEEALNALSGLGSVNGSRSVAYIEAAIKKACELHAQRNWEEFSSRAAGVKAATLFELSRAILEAQNREAEQAELQRLRAESVERERRDREERIAREASEKVEREAKSREEKAARDAESRLRKIEEDRTAAEARAAEVERRRVAEQKAASDRAERAAEQAERDKQAAVKAERDRVAEKAQREKEEYERREASARIRRRVTGEIGDAIIRLGVPNEQARFIAAAIVENGIPHVKVVF